MLRAAGGRDQRKNQWRNALSRTDWRNSKPSAKICNPNSANRNAPETRGARCLLGALVLHRLEKGQDEFSKKLGDWLNKELPGFLSRDDDKALFADLVKPPGEDAAKA